MGDTRKKLTPEQLLESEKFKEKGNEAFKKKDYKSAVEEWSRALELNPSDHLLYSNRSLGFIFLHEYHLAARDAYAAIKIQKRFAKAYYRLGLALSGLGHFAKSAESFAVGIGLSPENKEMRMGFEKAKKLAYEDELLSITWNERPIVADVGKGFEMRV